MPEVQLDHVLFARVEKPYSPKGSSGYQVVYQSPALGSVAAAIEKQVQCFQINRHHLLRHQFFWTAAGQAVCTRTVSLIAPAPDVVDRDQRDAFLVHALVLSRADFASIHNDPFALFAAAEQVLAGQVSQLVQYLRVAPPPARLCVPMRTWVRSAQDPSAEEVRQLYRLAATAAQLSGQKQSIQMIASDPGDIFHLLSSLLLLLPDDERAACTFDTFADGCSPIPGSYWTIGCTRPLNQGGFLPMRLAERQIARVRPAGPDSLYTTWLLQTLQDPASLAWLHEDLLSAQVIAASFTAHRALPDLPLSERAVHSFCQLHRQFIDSSCGSALASLMEKRLAEACTPALLATLPLPAQLTIAATGNCDHQMVAGLLYTWFLQVQPAWKDWDDVLDVATRAGSAPLLLLASLKAHPRLFKPYGRLVEEAIETLLGSGALPAVLADLAASAPGDEPPAQSLLSDEEFQTLVLALLKQQAGHLLPGPCVQRAGLLHERKIVLSLAKASQQVAPAFAAALQEHALYGK
ncbi:MAG TPA: hypothetical protein VGF67_06670 [Ktedonobacteraceae bacterium]|jgi:hypothetical protein